jgi:hypothetical protein
MSRNPALMLRSTVTALREQRQYLDGSRSRRAAYEHGLRNFRHHYAEQVLLQVGREWRDPRRWGALLHGMLTLMRYHPGGVARQSIRYVQQFLSRVRYAARLRSSARPRNA